MKKRRIILSGAAGVLIGIVNGMLGAGGGIITVPILKKMGLSQKEAHVNAVAVILPVTLLSATLYLLRGYVQISDAISYVPTGVLGAVLGTWIIKKISPLWLKRIFGALMVYAGVRMCFK